MAMHHHFLRDKDRNSCDFCDGLWPSTDEIISKFHVCQHCDLTAHSSCKALMTSCIECEPNINGNLIEVKRELAVGTLQGKLQVKVLQAKNINIAPGTSIYAKLQFYSTNQVISTPVAVTGENDCTWDVPAEEAQLVFPLRVNLLATGDRTEEISRTDFMICVELWTSVFGGFFDSLVAKTEISLLPLAAHPGVAMARWFAIHNISNASSTPTNSLHNDVPMLHGKVLLSLQFEPLSSAGPLFTRLQGKRQEVASPFDPESADPSPQPCTSQQRESEISLKSSSSPGLSRSGLALQLPRPRNDGENSHDERINDGDNDEEEEDEQDDDDECSVYSSDDNSTNYDIDDSYLVQGSEGSDASEAERDDDDDEQQQDVNDDDDGGSVSDEQASDEDGQVVANVGVIANSSQELKSQQDDETRPAPTATPENVVSVPSLVTSAVTAGSESRTLSTLDPTVQTPDSSGTASNTTPTRDTVLVNDSLTEFSVLHTAGHSDGSVAAAVESGESPPIIQETVVLEAPPATATAAVTSVANNSTAASTTNPEAVNHVLQSLLDFGEQTTTVIGNFFYDIEGLQHLRPGDAASTTAGSAAAAVEKTTDSKSNTPSKTNGNNDESAESNAATSGPPIKSTNGVLHSVGTMHIHLVSASRHKPATSATTTATIGTANEGDHYVTIQLEENTAVPALSHLNLTATKEWRSPVVHGATDLVFNSRHSLAMPHFRSVAVLTLCDGKTNRKIGSSKVSVYSVLQRDADRNISDWRQSPQETIPCLEQGSDTVEIGEFTVNISFEEAVAQLYLTTAVQSAQDSTAEHLSMEKLSVHITRFYALFDLFAGIYSDYLYIMDWRDPFLTSMLLMVFLYCTLKVSAEYLLSGVVFVPVLLMTRMYWRRKTGAYKQYYVRKGQAKAKKPAHEEPYCPVATLKLSVLAYRNLPPQLTAGTKPNIKVSYVPMIETDDIPTNAGKDEVNMSSNTIDSLRKEFLIGHLNSTTATLGCYAPTTSTARNVTNSGTSTKSNVSQLVSNISTITGYDGSTGDGGRDALLQNVNHPWPITPAEVLEAAAVSDIFNSDAGNSATSVTADSGTSGSHYATAPSTPVNLSMNTAVSSNPTSPLLQLSAAGTVLRSETADIALVYPILQPLTAKLRAVQPLSLNTSSVTSKRVDDHNTSYDVLLSGATDSYLVSTSNSHSLGHSHGQSQEPAASDVATASSAVGAKAATRERSETNASTLSTTTTTDKVSKKTSIHVPWDKNDGFVKVTLRYDNAKVPLGFNMITDDPLPNEYIRVPIKDLVASGVNSSCPEGPQPEIRKWFNAAPVLVDVSHLGSEANTDMLFPDIDNFLNKHSTKRRTSGTTTATSTHKPTQLLLRLQLDLPTKQAALAPTKVQKEQSKCLVKMLSGADETGTGKESTGGTISVLWNMRDNVKYVQNLMAWLLDSIESFKNIWNWTSPNKTWPIYCALIVLWLLTVFVPGRVLVLIVGLYQFLFVVLPIPDSDMLAICFYNLLQSIPNDDDLSVLYARERQMYKDSELTRLRETAKNTRINLSLKTLWSGSVKIKISSSSAGNNTASTLLSSVVGGNFSTSDWVDVYLMLQGMRLVWFQSEESIVPDNSSAGGVSGAVGTTGGGAAGQILLCGHTGITEGSPVDIKMFGDGSKERLVSVFGKDSFGAQHKLSVYCEAAADRDALYRLISELIAKSNE